MRPVRERDEVDNGACDHKEIRLALRLLKVTALNKCCQCCIIIADNPIHMPDEWQWINSGRYGDLCNGCVIDMKVDEKRRINALVDFGCIVCKRETMTFSNAEVHHLRDRRGVGQKKNHYKTIPLCPPHHRTGGYGTAFHAGQSEWELRHGKETELLGEVDKVMLTLGIEL